MIAWVMVQYVACFTHLGLPKWSVGMSEVREAWVCSLSISMARNTPTFSFTSASLYLKRTHNKKECMSDGKEIKDRI